MTPQRIAYVVNAFPKLSETFVAAELAELRRRGVAVRILSLRRPADEPRHGLVEEAGLLDVTWYDRGQYENELLTFGPELVHAHFATAPASVAREVAAVLGIPFTFTAHRYDIYEKAPSDLPERAAAADAVVTVSEANRRHLVRALDVAPERIHVVPCGVDTDFFRPAGERDEPSLVVCVARLKPFKDQATLLEACRRLVDRALAFRCVLVGDGPTLPALEATRARLGLEGVVEFAGPADQHAVLGWWRRASVAALPSRSEGMPVSLMEAGACGLPTVACAVGGVPELVLDGDTGLLVPPADPAALAAALERLLRDRVGAARMGARARDRIVDHFSLERQVQGLLGVWREPRRRPSGPIKVKDRRRAHSDPGLPTLRLALDPLVVKQRFKRGLSRIAAEGVVRVRRIRVTRHKAGRRALIEYDVRVERAGAPREGLTLVGKVRAGRSGKADFRLLDALRAAGFDERSNGVSVPEPIAVFPDLRLWLQRKVDGEPATELITGSGGPELAARIAEAAHGLHAAGVAAPRVPHTIGEELRILRQRLALLVRERPQWEGRVARLLERCERFGASLPQPAPAWIHRDFYADQVIVAGTRLYLVDFDLYCPGDPALDIGNFAGHLLEHALRELGDPDALAGVEEALTQRFLELAGSERRTAVDAYATLTLARHVQLSTALRGRAAFAPALLELCEERLEIRPRIYA